MFAVSDAVSLSLIAMLQAVFVGIISLVLAWMNKRQTQAITASSEKTTQAVLDTGRAAAEKTEEVKATLKQSTAKTAEALSGLAETGNKTHALVNSAMGAQLQLHAETARAKADITKDAADVAVADLAERMHREHTQKQAAADHQG